MATNRGDDNGDLSPPSPNGVERYRRLVIESVFAWFDDGWPEAPPRTAFLEATHEHSDVFLLRCFGAVVAEHHRSEIIHVALADYMVPVCTRTGPQDHCAPERYVQLLQNNALDGRRTLGCFHEGERRDAAERRAIHCFGDYVDEQSFVSAMECLFHEGRKLRFLVVQQYLTTAQQSTRQEPSLAEVASALQVQGTEQNVEITKMVVLTELIQFQGTLMRFVN